MKSDQLFDEKFIKKSIVPLWKFWLLPLIKPTVWRQARWTFTTEDGKKVKMKGLVKW